MAAFPATLPLPLAAGYRVAPVDQTVRTDMEKGHARVRRTSRARNDRVTLSWALTDAEAAVLRAWVDDDAGAAGGAAWFTVRLALGTGGLQTVTARFVKPPEYLHLGALFWSASAEVEVQ